jgi:hypothetical protein
VRPLHERLPETTLGTNQRSVETSTTRRDDRLSRGNGHIPRRTEQKGMGEKRSGMDSLNFDSQQKGQA